MAKSHLLGVLFEETPGFERVKADDRHTIRATKIPRAVSSIPFNAHSWERLIAAYPLAVNPHTGHYCQRVCLMVLTHQALISPLE